MKKQATRQGVSFLWIYFEKLLLLNLFTVALFLASKSSTAVSTETSFPLHTIAIAGQRMTLNCCVKPDEWPIDWFFVQGNHLNSSEYERRCKHGNLVQCIAITTGGIVTTGTVNRFNVSRYNDTGSNNQCSTLLVEETKMSHFGTYGCYADFKTTNNSFLTIIDSEPDCSFEKASMEFHCIISYFGITPRFQLESANGKDTNCNENNDKINCTIRHSMLTQTGNISCSFGLTAPIQRDGYEMTTIYILESNTGYNLTMSCSVKSTERKTTTETATTNEPGNSSPYANSNVTDERDSPDSTSYAIILVASICGVIGMAIIVAVLLIKCDTKRRKQKSENEKKIQHAAEPLYSMATELENEPANPIYSEPKQKKSSNKTPIYSEVKNKVSKKGKNSKSQPDFVIAETGIYNHPLGIYEQDTVNKSVLQNGQKNVEPDGVIYSELQNNRPKEPTQQRPVFQIREGFDRSVYAAVDHTFQAPPAPPPQKAARR